MWHHPKNLDLSDPFYNYLLRSGDTNIPDSDRILNSGPVRWWERLSEDICGDDVTLWQGFNTGQDGRQVRGTCRLWVSEVRWLKYWLFIGYQRSGDLSNGFLLDIKGHLWLKYWLFIGWYQRSGDLSNSFLLAIKGQATRVSIGFLLDIRGRVTRVIAFYWLSEVRWLKEWPSSDWQDISDEQGSHYTENVCKVNSELSNSQSQLSICRLLRCEWPVWPLSLPRTERDGWLYNEMMAFLPLSMIHEVLDPWHQRCVPTYIIAFPSSAQKEVFS